MIYDIINNRMCSSIVHPSETKSRAAPLAARMQEHGDPLENSPRVVHHGSFGNLLCVMREVRLGADALRAIPSKYEYAVDGASYALGAAL